jgi:hypothetical protein
MLSIQAPGFPISTIAAFSTGLGYSFSLLYHAPIRIKSFRTFQSLEEKGCGAERPQIPRSEATLWFPSLAPCPLLRTQKIVGSRPCPKGSTFMVGCQHRMAHGVVSKDEELGSMSGVERLTNQLSWLFQHKTGFPVPAQSDYRNILSSLNST